MRKLFAVPLVVFSASHAAAATLTLPQFGVDRSVSPGAIYHHGIGGAKGISGTQDPITGRFYAAAGPVSVTQFGAVADDLGLSGSGTPNAAAFQAAADWSVMTGREVDITPSASGAMYRIEAPVYLKGHMSFIGHGCAAYTNGTTGFSPGKGSILHFDHPGQGLVAGGNTTGPSEGMYLRKFCTYRSQPVPPTTGTWTPNTFDYDIVEVQDELYLDDITFIDADKGFLQQGGRVFAFNIEGQFFQKGWTITSALDIVYIDRFHVWPYGVQNTPVYNYVLQNLDALTLMRNDNAMLTNYSAVISKNCIRFSNNTVGPAPNQGGTNKLHAVNIDCDVFGGAALYADTTSTGVSGSVVNFTAQGFGSGSGGVAGFLGNNTIDAEGTGFGLRFFGLRSTATQGSGILLNSTGNTINIYDPQIETWGQGGGAPPAISALPGNSVNLIGPVSIGNGPAGGVAFGGGGGYSTTPQNDASGRPLVPGLNSVGPVLVVAQGTASFGFPVGSGTLQVQDQNGAVGMFMVTGGTVTLAYQTPTNEFQALNPGRATTVVQGDHSTPAGKVSVYYDTTLGKYNVFNNTGAPLSFQFSQIITRAAN